MCREAKIPLVEDGAQAFGTDFLGSSLFRDAFVSATSFYPSKVLGAAGNGGAVFTNDKKISEKLIS